MWTVDTRPGNHLAAIRWCACGALSYPATNGRWIGKNIRRHYYGAPLPAWHRTMTDLHHGPATALTPPLPQPHPEAATTHHTTRQAA